MRTIIDLRTEQVDALDAVCRRDSISRAEAIRRAVDELLEREARIAAKQAFGLWKGRDIDGLKYQEALRREWDR